MAKSFAVLLIKLPVMSLVSTSSTYFFSKGTFKIRKNYFEFFPINLLTSEYSSTVCYIKMIQYIQDGTIASFLTVFMESLKDLRSGFVINVDEKVLI